MTQQHPAIGSNRPGLASLKPPAMKHNEMRIPLSVNPSLLGTDGPPVLIAEISGNHMGSRSRFLELIQVAAEAGADLIKFQTYTPDTITLPVDTPAFRISAGHGLWGGRTLYSLYQEAMTPWEWHAEGFELARSLGADAFSSPFDWSAVDFLEQFDPPAYKIASLEVTDLDLIGYVSSKGRPVVISGGAATTAEMARAVEHATAKGASQVIPMLCTSSYPADPADARLMTIPAWTSTFGRPVGLSDHTLGIGVAVAAVALGCRVVEKHLTLSRGDGAIDGAFSMQPDEFAQLVLEVRAAWQAVQGVRTEPIEAEAESRRLRRSLYVSTSVKAGDTITRENVRSVRPAGGLETIRLEELLGRRFGRRAEMGTPMTLDLIESPGNE